MGHLESSLFRLRTRSSLTLETACWDPCRSAPHCTRCTVLEFEILVHRRSGQKGRVGTKWHQFRFGMNLKRTACTDLGKRGQGCLRKSRGHKQHTVIRMSGPWRRCTFPRSSAQRTESQRRDRYFH